MELPPPTEVGVFKILIKNLFQEVTADFVGMWVRQRRIQGIVGSVGKSAGSLYVLRKTFPHFP